MKIIEKKLSELTEYGNNPRHNENAIPAVAASIREFGFKVPIVIDADGVIIAGHTRKKAAESLGLETVPCVVADDLTPDQVRAFRLADNKTAELAGWDLGKLDDELSALVNNFDMSVFGFENEPFDETDLDKENEKTGGVKVTITFNSVVDFECAEESLKSTAETNNGTVSVAMV